MAYLVIFLLLLLAGCSSSTEEDFSLQSCTAKLSDYPSYSYPYSNLPEEFSKEGKNFLLLFSYGSLMDVHSASRTLSSKTVSSSHLALAFGIRRLFDRDVPIKPNSSLKIPCDPNARGMLNIHPSEYPEEFVNGVLIKIPLNEVSALLSREEGYDLIPIVVADWKDLLEKKFICQIAYTLCAPSESSYTDSDIFPRPGYYEMARNAAAQFGPLFLFLWENTTFMADGKTPIFLWEKWLKESDPRTCLK